jgi:hypothetical protein
MVILGLHWNWSRNKDYMQGQIKAQKQDDFEITLMK